MTDIPLAERPVFVSYSRTDKEFVNKLISDFQAHSIAVWVDKFGLRPGMHNWDLEIRAAIQASNALVLVASPGVLSSNYVQDEVSIAQLYKRPIYAIWATGDDWLNCVPLGMGKIQYI